MSSSSSELRTSQRISERKEQQRMSDKEESEMSTNLLIYEFESGTLADCLNGVTLKSYLSSKINLEDFLVADLIEQGVDFNVSAV